MISQAAGHLAYLGVVKISTFHRVAAWNHEPKPLIANQQRDGKDEDKSKT